MLREARRNLCGVQLASIRNRDELNRKLKLSLTRVILALADHGVKALMATSQTFVEMCVIGQELEGAVCIKLRFG